MSVIEKMGWAAWVYNQAETIKSAYKVYEDTKSTDAFLNVVADIGELVGIGIPSWYIDKVFEKTGLDKVFDELRSGKTAEEYASHQAAIKNLRDTTSAFLLQKGLDALNDYLSRHGTLDPAFNLFFGGSIDPAVNKNFHYGATHDPLVLDLGAKGIQTTAADGSMLADYTGSGVKHGTGWVGPQDGFLVMDRNGDGQIELSQDLFGGHTFQQASMGLGLGSNAIGNASSSNSGTTKLTAFQELKLLDSNGDGIINKDDTNFSKLKVWQDTNQDGVVEAGELKSLTDLGITSISLKGDGKTQDLGNGNSITSSATFTYSDGTTSTISAVNLAQNNFYRQFEKPVTVPDSLKDLPDMQGSGAVRDLQQAAALSPALATTLRNYANATSASEQAGMLDDLIEKWADSSNFKNFVQRIDAMGSNTYHWEFDIVPPTPATSGSSDTGTAVSGASSGSSSGYGAGLVSIPNGPKLVDGNQLHVGLFPNDDKIQALAKIKVLEVFNDEKFFNLTPEKNSAGQYTGGLSELCGVHTWGSSATMVSMNHTIYVTNKNLEFGGPQEDRINQAYKELKGSIYRALLLQTRLKPYIEAIKLNVDNQQKVLGFDFSGLNALFSTRLSQGGAAGKEDFFEFIATAGRELLGRGWTWGREKAAELITPTAIENAGPTFKYVMGQPDGDGLFVGKTSGQSVNGGSAADILIAGASQETLSGGAGDDLLMTGKAGGNILDGGTGNDTYLLQVGTGWDTIHQGDAASTDKDTIAFANTNISAADVLLTKVGNNLKVGAGQDGFTVTNWFKGPQYQVAQFQFADGTTVSTADLMAQLGVHDTTSGSYQTINGWSGADDMVATGSQDSLNGNAGNDVLSDSNSTYQNYLNGGAGNDTLKSAGGGDVLDGGTGNDTYLLQSGTGWDSVHQGDSASTDTDTVAFADKSINEDSLTLSKSGDVLNIQAGDSGFHMTNWFKGAQYQVEQFQFADGTTVSTADLMAQLGVHDTTTGSYQTINGWSGADDMVATGSQDSLNGNAGNDVLSDSNSTHQNYLNGGAGNDILLGGGGGDVLNGGSGSDTYVFSGNFGANSVVGDIANPNNQDSAKFTGIEPDQLWFQQRGNDLLATVLGTGNNVDFKGWFADDRNKLDSVEMDGMKASSTDIDKLVSAMAAFNPPSGAGAVMTAAEKTALQPVLASSWHNVT